MAAFIEKLLPKPSIVAGVDLYIHSDGTKNYHAVLLQLKRKQVNIIKSVSATVDLKTIGEQLGITSTVPVCLSINGRGLLIRKTPFQDNMMNTVQQVFPGVKHADFHMQK